MAAGSSGMLGGGGMHALECSQHGSSKRGGTAGMIGLGMIGFWSTCMAGNSTAQARLAARSKAALGFCSPLTFHKLTYTPAVRADPCVRSVEMVDTHAL